jgi:hypothetical protein
MVAKFLFDRRDAILSAFAPVGEGEVQELITALMQPVGEDEEGESFSDFDMRCARALRRLSSDLARVTGERDTLKAFLDAPISQFAEWERRALTAERALETARKALRPFAEFSSGYGRHARDDSWVLVESTSGARRITMGDVRAAEDTRQALATLPETEKTL